MFAVPDTILEIVPANSDKIHKDPQILTCDAVLEAPAPIVDKECFCHNHSEDCTCSGHCLVSPNGSFKKE